MAQRMWSAFKDSWQQRRKDWGAWAGIMLLLSISSGVILALQYDYTSPWYSSTAIELLAPFGSFFRSLHFYSSQTFFLLTLCHVIFAYRKAKRYTFAEWLRLTTVLPVVIALLFTGYVLRGDSTGASAGHIAENIILSLPMIGNWCNTLLLDLERSGLRKVYIHHIIGFDLILLSLLWLHLHVYRIRLWQHIPLILGISTFCLLIKAPFEPENSRTLYISGPWFFLGLQELLRYLSPAVAGCAVPLSFIVLLIAAHPANRFASLISYIIYGWLGFYAIFSIIALCRT